MIKSEFGWLKERENANLMEIIKYVVWNEPKTKHKFIRDE